jgi:hypothetical protein
MIAAEEEIRQELGLSKDDEIPDGAWDEYEACEEEYLIGDWRLDEASGRYEIEQGCNGAGFAAELSWLGGAPLLFILWSEQTEFVRSMCSPCCPGSADLDSGPGMIEAYAVPRDEDHE